MSVEGFGYLSFRAIMATVAKVLVALVLFVSGLEAYYLPGVTPSGFNQGDTVSLKANKVTSTKTPLQYDYYDLPFCKRKKTKARAENLGERLSGDSLTTSPYEVLI